MGTPKQYIQSIKDLANGLIKLDNLTEIDPSSKISPLADLRGAIEMGKNCNIEDDVILEDSILWDNVLVGKGSEIKNSILGSNAVIPPNSKIINDIVVSNKIPEISG